MDVALVVCAGLAVAAGLGALLVTARARAGVRRDVAAARAESDELRGRLEQLETVRRAAVPEPITPVVVPREAAPAATLPGPVFADRVLAESVIRLASLSHGVRRALSPEQRRRIRFEIRSEVRRSRKQRRSDLKAALRRLQATEREDAA